MYFEEKVAKGDDEKVKSEKPGETVLPQIQKFIAGLSLCLGDANNT